MQTFVRMAEAEKNEKDAINAIMGLVFSDPEQANEFTGCFKTKFG